MFESNFYERWQQRSALNMVEVSSFFVRLIFSFHINYTFFVFWIVYKLCMNVSFLFFNILWDPIASEIESERDTPSTTQTHTQMLKLSYGSKKENQLKNCSFIGRDGGRAERISETIFLSQQMFFFFRRGLCRALLAYWPVGYTGTKKQDIALPPERCGWIHPHTS